MIINLLALHGLFNWKIESLFDRFRFEDTDPEESQRKAANKQQYEEVHNRPVDGADNVVDFSNVEEDSKPQNLDGRSTSGASALSAALQPLTLPLSSFPFFGLGGRYSAVYPQGEGQVVAKLHQAGLL